MTPSHIRNEVLRRIRSAEDLDPQLIAALGIDPETNPDELEERIEHHATPDRSVESEPFWGYVPFELTVNALGETGVVDCRAAYVVTLHDEEDRFGNGPFRQICGLTMRYELLEWRREDACDEAGVPCRDPVPIWTTFNLFPIIPHAVQCKIDDTILEQALEAEQSQRQQSTV